MKGDNGRVRGLDAIRFVLAVWVMIGHSGSLPYVDTIPRDPLLLLVLRGVCNNLVSGPAAVIAFFVISGFCIHYPYRLTRQVTLFPYYARRHIRILVPAAVAIGLARQQGFSLALFQNSILWSLVCEEIYYTIYPLILRLRDRFSFSTMVSASFVAALGVVLTRPDAGNYPSYGWHLNWLLGLPCWLLGCQLAERWDSIGPNGEHVTSSAIWRWRLALIAASAMCSVLRFHTPLTYPWTLNIFALLAYRWLEAEVVRAQTVTPIRALEWAGAFSFSIYLFHRHAQRAFASVITLSLGELSGWILANVVVLAACYLFYLVVERPSHLLARQVYGFLMRFRQVRAS